MFTLLAALLCAIQILTESWGLSFIDLPSDSDEPDNGDHITSGRLLSDSSTISANVLRRYMPGLLKKPDEMSADATDKYLKQKITNLIDQTLKQVTNKVNSVQDVKELSREEAAYKAGFITSMVKKCRLMLNDLFNLAVKHRDNWKALQQLKVFEYIVHVNVDTTNLVRQLVEIHLQHLNATNPRVVLL